MVLRVDRRDNLRIGVLLPAVHPHRGGGAVHSAHPARSEERHRPGYRDQG